MKDIVSKKKFECWMILIKYNIRENFHALQIPNM